MSLEGWIALVALAIQTISLIIGGAWALSRIVAAIRADIASDKLENQDRVNAAIRSIGETFTAMRQKIAEVDSALGNRITQIELYVRDTYLQKDSFRAVISEITRDMKDLGERIERSVERMEKKMDKARADSE